MSAAVLAPAQVAARIAEIIRTRPAAWNQRTWLELPLGHSRDVASMLEDLDHDECGTTACVAGWAAILAAPAGARAMACGHGMIRSLSLPDDSVTEIKAAGAAALGLDTSGAYWLFDVDRTRDEVLAALDEIAAGRPVTRDGDEEEDDDDLPF